MEFTWIQIEQVGFCCPFGSYEAFNAWLESRVQEAWNDPVTTLSQILSYFFFFNLSNRSANLCQLRHDIGNSCKCFETFWRLPRECHSQTYMTRAPWNIWKKQTNSASLHVTLLRWSWDVRISKLKRHLLSQCGDLWPPHENWLTEPKEFVHLYRSTN